MFFIVKDPGADSGGEGKSKRATKRIGEEKSREQRIAIPRARDFSWPIFFVTRLDFPSPPLSAPGSPRMAFYWPDLHLFQMSLNLTVSLI